MKLKYAQLDVTKTCGHEFYLTESAPVFNYQDGKRVGEPVAYAYTVVLPERKFEPLRVRIEGPCQHEAGESAAPVTFENLSLEIKWSKTEGDHITGTATRITSAANAAGKK